MNLWVVNKGRKLVRMVNVNGWVVSINRYVILAVYFVIMHVTVTGLDRRVGGNRGGRREQVLHFAQRRRQHVHHPTGGLPERTRIQGSRLQHCRRQGLPQRQHGNLCENDFPQRTGSRQRDSQRRLVVVVFQVSRICFSRFGPICKWDDKWQSVSGVGLAVLKLTY